MFTEEDEDLGGRAMLLDTVRFTCNNFRRPAGGQSCTTAAREGTHHEIGIAATPAHLYGLGISPFGTPAPAVVTI